jgi:hypothetical protein
MWGDGLFVKLVRHELMSLGWDKFTIPPASDKMFSGAISELRRAGANPQRAAELLSEALHGNEQFCKLVAEAGPNAEAIFGSGHPYTRWM